MTAVLSLDGRWQPARAAILPKALQPWLLAADSLTARLKARSSQFRLQLLSESAQPLPLFLQDCFAQPISACRRREVVMWCNEQPAVYAQSWLPESTLANLTPLLALGEQPLGEWLFQYPDVRRSPLEVAQLHIAGVLGSIAANDYWARRSVFYVAEQPLLVAEVFLPGVYNL